MSEVRTLKKQIFIFFPYKQIKIPYYVLNSCSINFFIVVALVAGADLNRRPQGYEPCVGYLSARKTNNTT